MLEARLDQVNDMMIETKARLDCVMDQIQEVSTGIMETKERLESVESRTETYFDQTRMELLEVDSRIAGVKDMIQFTEQQLQDVRDSAGANDETATILACVEDTIGERLREVNEMVLDTKVQRLIASCRVLMTGRRISRGNLRTVSKWLLTGLRQLRVNSRIGSRRLLP